MNIKDYSEGKLNGKIITISRGFDTRAKKLHVFYFTVFFLFGLIFLRMTLESDRIDNTIQLILFLLVPTFLILIAYRFANKAVQSEKLIVNKYNLTLVKAGLFTSQKRTYEVKHIENFRHLAHSQLSKHPLTGESFDYTGLNMTQNLANSVHSENRVAFDYKGLTIKFGENIYSWDFNELEALLYDITGNDLRYTETVESTFDAGDEAL
jgi:hypothetical protein